MEVTLLYNPKAGKGTFPTKKTISILENYGAKVLAQSTKENKFEKVLEHSCDFIIIAGGDGTVEKTGKLLLREKMDIPIAILPYGNANNIANSLDLPKDCGKIIHSWQNKDFKYFSVGVVETEKEKSYFLESVGWGLFGKVLATIKSSNQKQPKKKKVAFGSDQLENEVKKIQPSFYRLFLDGEDYSGHYLWIEIMNTRWMGPQLHLAPKARHQDKFLDVVLVCAEERAKLETYINETQKGKMQLPFSTIKVRKVKIGSSLPFHIDDELRRPDHLTSAFQVWSEVSLSSKFIQAINTSPE